MGFALSNVGDGNTMVSVMQSYGGRIADDAGKTVTIKSDETRTFLTWVNDAWDAGLFPPGATTWDGAGDNNAYLAGQAIFIANTGSVHIAAQTDDPGTRRGDPLRPAPGRSDGTISPISLNAPRDPESTAGRRHRQGAARVPGQPGVHGGLLQRRHLRPGPPGATSRSRSSPTRSTPVSSTSSRPARRPASPTSTTPPMPTSPPTSSCRR